MTTIKFSWLAIGAVIAPLFLSKPQLDQQAASMAPVVDFKRQEQAQRREDSATASEARKDSRVALSRVKLLCTPVVAKGTETASVLADGGEAVDIITGLPLVEGSFVCTARGSTGQMQGGLVQDVRNATRDDMTEYSKYFAQQ